MGQARLAATVVKVHNELASVIGLDVSDGKRSHLKEFTQEVITVGRGVGLVGVGEGNLVLTSSAAKM